MPKPIKEVFKFALIFEKKMLKKYFLLSVNHLGVVFWFMVYTLSQYDFHHFLKIFLSHLYCSEGFDFLMNTEILTSRIKFLNTFVV